MILLIYTNMKTTFFFLAVFILQYNSNAQNSIKDKLNYKITYELTYKLDSTALDEEKSEYMILFAGDDVSVFSSRAKTLAHNIVVKGNMAHTSREAVTDFQYVILKSAETDKIYYTLEITKDLFYYEQKKNLFDWEIAPETKMIKGYQVQKATTSFAGRDYVAWFTPEVPISDGPYKFNGLPGLILEMADSENHYVFKFIGLEKLSPAKRFKANLRRHYIKTDKEALLTRFHEYRSDPLGYSWAQGLSQNVSMDPKLHKEEIRLFKKRLEKENNRLELE